MRAMGTRALIRARAGDLAGAAAGYRAAVAAAGHRVGARGPKVKGFPAGESERLEAALGSVLFALSDREPAAAAAAAAAGEGEGEEGAAAEAAAAAASAPARRPPTAKEALAYLEEAMECFTR